MSHPASKTLDREIEQQTRLIHGLMAAFYASNDADPDKSLQLQLVEAQKTLRDLQKRRHDERVEQEKGQAVPKGTTATPLGLGTTGLKVETTIRLQPIPTGVYHLLDPEIDPLLTVTVKNESYEPRRVCVTAYIEGLSARDIKTFEIGKVKRDGESVNLLPSLLPEQARRITEVQRCTLHVRVEIFGSIKNSEARIDTWTNLIESHDTYSLVLLARNSSFNSVVDPATGRPRDLTRYYAAWVTPHVDPVQALVRRAAERVPGRRMWGYQGKSDPEATATQVKALFDTLKEAGIAYIDSVIDFGAGPGQVTQRTRLPRESLRHRSANCIDGTVLFASLLESASLHAAIVLVPGHAFVAWEKWKDGEWDYLETTMINSHDFDAARRRARMLYRQFDIGLQDDDGSLLRMLKLNDLRAHGIWPME